MRRGIFDTLRRGFDNTIANWQVSLIRFGEVLLFVVIAVAAFFAILTPILLSVGIRIADIDTPAGVESVVEALLQKWMIIFWIILIVSVLLLVFLALHAFVEAGCARIAVDADRLAGPAVMGPRSRYAIFSMERWLTGAKDGFWEVFWIYNATWGLAGLVLLIPLLPLALVAVLARNNPGPAVVITCLALIVFFFVMIVVAIITGMWTNRSIVEWAARRTGIRASLAAAWRAVIRTDLGRHIAIALMIMVVAMAASTFFAGFGFVASLGESMSNKTPFNVITFPLRFIGSLLNWILSALITTWYLTSYAALAVEGRS